jgi:hypothetical protein
MTNDEARQAGRHTEPPGAVAANDNALGAASTRIDATVRKSRVVEAVHHRVDVPTTAAAKDDEPAAPRQAAANDNKTAATPQPANDNDATAPLQAAANDNEATAPALRAVAAVHPTPNDSTDIRVIDDLPRPLPVLPGEAAIVRRLLGARLRQILSGKEKL